MAKLPKIKTPPANKPVATLSPTLKHRQWGDIHGALLELDGLRKIAPKEEGKDSETIFEPFKYTGKFTLHRVRLLGAIKVRLMEVEDTQKKLRAQFKLDSVKGADRLPAFKAYNEAEQKLLDETATIAGLKPLTLADLNLYDPEDNRGGNKIASSIIERISLLIADLAEEPDGTPAEEPDEET